MEIFKIETWYKQKPLHMAFNTYIENETAVFNFLYETTTVSLTMNLNFVEKKFSIQSSEALKSFTCLIICGASALGPVADCFRKSKDFDEFDECLKNQGMGLSSSLLGCIAACFAVDYVN
jgi:hypothetical protein